MNIKCSITYFHPLNDLIDTHSQPKYLDLLKENFRI